MIARLIKITTTVIDVHIAFSVRMGLYDGFALVPGVVVVSGSKTRAVAPEANITMRAFRRATNNAKNATIKLRPETPKIELERLFANHPKSSRNFADGEANVFRFDLICSATACSEMSCVFSFATTSVYSSRMTLKVGILVKTFFLNRRFADKLRSCADSP